MLHTDRATPDMTEDTVTKSIERYTAAVPSSAYLGIAIAAIALSLAAQIDKGKWATSSPGGCRPGYSSVSTTSS